MPTKNVYVSEADLPLFEQAADLAGALSTAVVTGLRLYVAQEEKERKASEMSVIELNVDDGPVVKTKRFTGRQILRYQDRDGMRNTSYRVYVTAKGQYAVYTRNDPNWSAFTDGSPPSEEDVETWKSEWWKARQRTLRVFSDRQSMEDELPLELFDALSRAEQQPAIEDLDI